MNLLNYDEVTQNYFLVDIVTPLEATVVVVFVLVLFMLLFTDQPRLRLNAKMALDTTHPPPQPQTFMPLQG